MNRTDECVTERVFGYSTFFLVTGELLKDLFHPACLTRVVSWLAFVVAIFIGHENGDKQRLAKR